MASNLDEEEPMEIDNQDEEVAIPSEPLVETEQESNSKDAINPFEDEGGISTESNENLGESVKSGNEESFQGIEEITINEGVVGDGEEAEVLQLNAPDFSDETDEQEQLFGNEEESTDNLDDPLLSRQEGLGSDLLDQDLDKLEAGRDLDSEPNCILLEDGEGDDSLTIDEGVDKNQCEQFESVEENKSKAGVAGDKEEDQDGVVKSNEDFVCNEEIADDDKLNEEDSKPMIRLRMDGIFEKQDDDDEDDEDNVLDVQSMMQMNFQEDDQGSKESGEDQSTTEELPTRRSLPRRAAATAAAHTIREISNVESGVEETTSRRSKKKQDETYRIDTLSYVEPKKNINNCSVCKKNSPSGCPIKIQQFGTDVHLCSNACLNVMRHPGTTRQLACVKCKASNLTGSQIMYWETMNFCSDLCVGNYQVEVGGKCSTCVKKVPWLSLGKYCVRFGSDIRQFCSAGCLENYKKNARVCFHCQLDIKRLGNVILANIPSKNTPKEFCSQECVEMYVEHNISTTVKSKQNLISRCHVCRELKSVFRELGGRYQGTGGLKVCSVVCWYMLTQKNDIKKTVKCEKCVKYLPLEDELEPPPNYIATEEKMYCFCSPTCKNVFVLNNRQILSCTTCKVKKYNYDLVQVYNNRFFVYAICSLNCLPKGQDYISNLKMALLPPLSASEMVARIGSAPAFVDDMDLASFPVIDSVSSMSSNQTTSNQSDPGGLAGIIHSHLSSIAGSIVGSNSTSTYTMPQVQETCRLSGSNRSYEAQVNNALPADSRWDGILKESDITDILDMLKPVVEMKSKSTSAKVKHKVIETQTDVSELDDMQRVPLKTVEKIRYVPFPIPYPVYIPTPTFFCETPIPYPVAVPIPVPIPIPVIFNGISHSINDNKESRMEINNPPGNGSLGVDISNDIEAMNCDDLSSISVSGCVTVQSDNGPLAFTDTISPSSPPSIIAVNTSSSSSAVSLNSLNSSNTSLHSGNVSELASSPGGGRRKLTRVEYGIRAWKMSFGTTSDPLSYSPLELAAKLAEWVNKGTKPNGERYRADIILYLCLGVQQHLRENKRTDSIFYDTTYHPFVKAITNYAESDCAQGIITRIEDSHFWESKELGGSSPGVLLFSLIYFIFKNFNLRTWEKHFALKFGQIKIEERCDSESGHMYKIMSIVEVPECDGMFVREKIDCADKCPVGLLESYIRKCEGTDEAFYKAINPNFSMEEKWFTSESLDKMEIYQMLVRAMMIKADGDTK